MDAVWLWILGAFTAIAIPVVGYAFVEIGKLHKRVTDQSTTHHEALLAAMKELAGIVSRVAVLESEHSHAKEKVADHTAKIDKFSEAIGQLAVMSARLNHFEASLTTMARAIETLASRMPYSPPTAARAA